MIPSAPPPAAYSVPAWWREPAFTGQEVSEFIAVPFETTVNWLRLAGVMGLARSAKKQGRRLYSAHDVYVVSLLATLYRLQHPVGDAIIRQAYSVAIDDEGDPRAPQDGEEWHICRGGNASLTVQAWLVYSAARHWCNLKMVPV